MSEVKEVDVEFGYLVRQGRVCLCPLQVRCVRAICAKASGLNSPHAPMACDHGH